MKNTGKAAKFFIICAVIFGIGLLTTILGAAFGGVDGLKEVAEKRDWLYDSPGQLVMDYTEQEDFDAINAEGDFDLHIVSEKSFGDKTWQREHGLDKNDKVLDYITITDNDVDPVDEDGAFHPTAGCVLVVRGAKVKNPDITVNKGVLNINAAGNLTKGIHLNFSSTPVTPAVYVFVSDDALASIKANMLSGDLSVYGASIKKMNVDSVSGDLNMKEVKGDDLKLRITSGDVEMSHVTLKNADIESASGDIEMSGKFTGTTIIKALSGDVDAIGRFRGETNINSASGDVNFSTNQSSAKYELSVTAFSGEATIREGGSTEHLEDIPVTITRKGSPNKLTIEAASGDLALSFGEQN